MLLIVGITFIFCLGDLDSVLNTPTGQPVIQVFYNATQSVAGTSIMVVVIIIILLSACVGQVATSSRQIWSFARDKGEPQSVVHGCARRANHAWHVIGFPGSHWLEKVPPAWNIPVNAIVVSAIFTSLLSLINLGTLPYNLLRGITHQVIYTDIRIKRIVHCFQRLQLSRHRLNLVLLQHHDRLPYLATPVRKAFAPQTLVTGSSQGSDNQHLCTLLHNPNVVLLYMAVVLPGHYRVHVGSARATIDA